MNKKNMILGLSSFTYGWKIGSKDFRSPFPPDEKGLLEKTMQMGLGCLQLGDNLPAHLLDQERRLSLKREASKNSIRLELGARGMTRAHLDLYIALATYFEAPLLRFVIDGEGYEPGTDTILGILNDVKPVLERRRIVLGIENHDRLKSRELAGIIEKAGSDHIGICLDCANSLGAGEGLEQVAGILAPYTVNLHIKDFTITRLPHKMGFKVEGAPFGKGLLDLDFLMEELRKYGRCKSAVLEQWVPPEASPEDSVFKEEAWAEEGIGRLRATRYFGQLHSHTPI